MTKAGLNHAHLNKVWEQLVGSKTDFPLEHRLFNAVCVISMGILLVFTPFNFLIGLHALGFIFSISFFICITVYYLSRYKRRYEAGTTIFAAVMLGLMCANYFLNDGMNGPTVFGLLISFHFIIIIKPPRQYPFWVVLHVLLVLALYLTEAFYPQSVHHLYTSYSIEIQDKYTTYVVILLFTFFSINYIRRNYHYEKVSAERRAEAIETQHLQIAAQHLQLERLNQEKNKMFSIISHDLRSPLDSIRSYLELLSAGVLSPDERATLETQLMMVTANTGELLQNLLSWSKSQMEGVAAKSISLNMYTLLHSSLEVQEKIAAKKGIALSYSIDDSIHVLADPDMLQLVVRNLVSNAIKFTPHGGSIRIKSYVQDGRCELAIKDTGQGIPVDRQGDIFTLKTSSTYGTDNEKGVGLGLVLCKEFTELQGGEIWFESGEDTGTTFYVALPLAINNQMQLGF